MLLSKVYGVLDKSIFEEIANDIVSDCTVSLLSAATQVSTRSGESHGSLFLIKHLVILREQISPFDVEFSRVERRLDFSSSFTGFLSNNHSFTFSFRTEPLFRDFWVISSGNEFPSRKVVFWLEECLG